MSSFVLDNVWPTSWYSPLANFAFYVVHFDVTLWSTNLQQLAASDILCQISDEIEDEIKGRRSSVILKKKVIVAE